MSAMTPKEEEAFKLVILEHLNQQPGSLHGTGWLDNLSNGHGAAAGKTLLRTMIEDGLVKHKASAKAKPYSPHFHFGNSKI